MHGRLDVVALVSSRSELIYHHLNLKVSAHQRQPPYQKENNGDAFQGDEETHSFLPEDLSPVVEQETSVWRHRFMGKKTVKASWEKVLELKKKMLDFLFCYFGSAL